MNDRDAKIQRERLAKYSNLCIRRDHLQQALISITQDDKTGPCGQGPFTGNTRESRITRGVVIQFSQTRGGAAETSLELSHLEIEASDFGRWLQTKIEESLESINGEISKL